jgi:hypothetical protein
MTNSETGSEKRALYDWLGGIHSIATAVEDLIDRIICDPRLNCSQSSLDSACSAAGTENLSRVACTSRSRVRRHL